MKTMDRNRSTRADVAAGMPRPLPVRVAVPDVPDAGVRPAASGQAVVQQRADGSPRVRQLQALQRMADGSVLQLKAFARGKLNVAGENHDESGGRREREAAISHQDVGGGYWTEDEFQVNVNGTQVRADPKILNFLSGLHGLRRLWNVLENTKLPAEYIPHLATTSLQATGPLIDLVSRLYAESMGDRYSGGAGLSVEQGQERDRVNAVRYGHFDAATASLHALASADPYSRDKKALVEEQFGQFKVAAVAMTDKVMEDNGLIVLRSKAMHNAAVAMAGSVGVWKIGQRHVDDIKKIDADPSAYNLMTQGDFNDEYDRISSQMSHNDSGDS